MRLLMVTLTLVLLSACGSASSVEYFAQSTRDTANAGTNRMLGEQARARETAARADYLTSIAPPPTPTPEPTATATQTATPEPTATATPMPTATIAATATPTPEPTTAETTATQTTATQTPAPIASTNAPGSNGAGASPLPLILAGVGIVGLLIVTVRFWIPLIARAIEWQNHR